MQFYKNELSFKNVFSKPPYIHHGKNTKTQTKLQLNLL